MTWKVKAAQAFAGLKIIASPNAAGTAGARSFWEKNYKTMKAVNRLFPFGYFPTATSKVYLILEGRGGFPDVVVDVKDWSDDRITELVEYHIWVRKLLGSMHRLRKENPQFASFLSEESEKKFEVAMAALSERNARDREAYTNLHTALVNKDADGILNFWRNRFAHLPVVENHIAEENDRIVEIIKQNMTSIFENTESIAAAVERLSTDDLTAYNAFAYGFGLMGRSDIPHFDLVRRYYESLGDKEAKYEDRKFFAESPAVNSVKDRDDKGNILYTPEQDLVARVSLKLKHSTAVESNFEFEFLKLQYPDKSPEELFRLKHGDHIAAVKKYAEPKLA